jgi:hypothetical protein
MFYQWIRHAIHSDFQIWSDDFRKLTSTSSNLDCRLPNAKLPVDWQEWVARLPNLEKQLSTTHSLTQQILNFHWQLPLLNLPVSWTKSVSQLPGLEKQLSTTYVSKRGFWLATPMCEDSYSQTNISFPTSKIGKTTPNNLRLKIRIPLATSKSPP